MSFSEKLQNLRKEKKYSQEDLADKLDVTRQSVSKWESGQTYPEMDKLLALCKIFNCTLDELTNDQITEISTKEKTGFNSIIDSVLDFVTRTYNMFTSMSPKELIKCVLLMFVVGCIILMLSIPLNALEHEIYKVLVSFGSTKIAGNLSALINFVLNITSTVISLFIFIHIFKIGFLDNYEINNDIEEIKDDNSKEETLEEKKEIKKVEKVIKRKKETNYAFFDYLGSLIVLFVKGMILLFMIPFIMLFIMLFCVLVVSIYFIFTGIIYLSVPVLVISSIVFTYLIIEILTKVIFNKSQNFKKVIILFILSITGLGVGTGILLLDIHKTDIVTNLDDKLKTITKVYEYKYIDGLFFHTDYNKIEYVVNDKLKDNIDINISTYVGLDNTNFYVNENGYYINNQNPDPTFVKELIDIVLDGLKNKKIYNISSEDNVIIKITSSQKTIDKLKENLVKHFENIDREYERYNSYISQIDELRNSNNNLEEKIYELENDKNNLKEELREYKNRVKDILGSED